MRRIGGNLTPARVSTILQSADLGYTTDLVDLGNEARQKDGHLHSVLFTRETALCGLDLQVQPYVERGATRPTARAQLVADFVEDALEQALGLSPEIKGLQDLLVHMQGGIYWGYAQSETVWRVDGGAILPAGFICHSPRRFCFRDSDGALVQWDDSVTGMRKPEIDVQKAWPGRWIQHQPRVLGDVPAREGLLRVLIWPALFRNWDFSDWLRLAELAWKPWRIGKYKEGATSKDIDALVEALEALTSNGIATISERVELDIRQPNAAGKGDASDHQALAEFFGAEISKAALGQTLTTDQGRRGARSLGEVHAAVRMDIRSADALAAASTLRRDLVAWIVRLNFGDAEPIPRLRIVTTTPQNVAEFARGVSDLVKVGHPVAVAWVNEHIGQPEPRDGEQLLEAPKPPAPAAPQDDGEDVDLTDLESDESATDDETA
jgi:phage gp29-like protein